MDAMDPLIAALASHASFVPSQKRVLPEEGGKPAPQGEPQKAPLSQTTIDTYTVRLRMLTETTGKGLRESILDPKGSNAKLQAKYGSAATRKNVVTAVVAVLARAKFPATVRAAWKTRLRHLLHIDQVARDDNRTSDAVRGKMIDVQEVSRLASRLLKRGADTLKESQEQLALTMFVDMPPRRADFGRLVVKHGGPAAVRKWSGPAGKGTNVVVMPKNGPVVLVMHEYKTAKTYGVHVDDMPRVVSTALRKSLNDFPREHVFGPMSASGFGHFVTAAFQKHTGKAANINLLRHAYITQVADPKTKTQAELKKIAKSMCHGIEMQGAYNLVGGALPPLDPPP
jgi:hypothetical protein